MLSMHTLLQCTKQVFKSVQGSAVSKAVQGSARQCMSVQGSARLCSVERRCAPSSFHSSAVIAGQGASQLLLHWQRVIIQFGQKQHLASDDIVLIQSKVVIQNDTKWWWYNFQKRVIIDNPVLLEQHSKW